MGEQVWSSVRCEHPQGSRPRRQRVKSLAMRGLVMELLVECDVRTSSPASVPSKSLPETDERSPPGSDRANGDIFGDIDVTKNPPTLAPVNQRQQWFLSRVALGE